jgi:predicted nucleotidyltransferase
MSHCLLVNLCKKQLVTRGNIPSWLPEAVQYEVTMGSEAYGVSSNTSDIDVYGFAIPDKHEIFPHLRGEIDGFGTQKNRFEVWQMHRIEDKEARGGEGCVYDCQYYSIVKYMDLVMRNNPNMVDSLFVPQRCIRFATPVGQRIRDSRKLFLHKGSWHTYRGYAFSQLSKIFNKEYKNSPKRRADIEKHGYSTKEAYHTVRLMLEAQQILEEGDVDLERNREVLKTIRAGSWSADEVKKYFTDKEHQLEKTYTESTLRHHPDEAAIKALLLDCLEQHFGSLSEAVVREDSVVRAMRQIDDIVQGLRTSGAI